ncbi:uncharacterized protein NPIL_255021 [Nephila pilipes]|uniref:Reverse transcriptase RNase H-like domain-containing protein n=1 Tax=Nephila pilipes TaxID=299642 RepID=A0A8X6N292_NEPPI|nr:uncharacterized protein NPIL_255021 [Nephila pilipes]
MLAVAWCLRKFHYYVHGREVTVYTDHKPLESIKKKPLHKAPKCFRSMLTRTQKYNYEMIYKPGKNIPIPHTLSTTPLEETSESSDSIDDIVYSVNTLPIRGICLERIIQHSNGDE